MSNSLTTNPIVIDSVMGSVGGLGKRLPIKLIYWFNPTTAGHAFSIHDGSAGTHILLEGRAEADNQSQLFKFDPAQTWTDFQVSVLGSGKLYIYI